MLFLGQQNSPFPEKQNDMLVHLCLRAIWSCKHIFEQNIEEHWEYGQGMESR
jgi:hypothetical protein